MSRRDEVSVVVPAYRQPALLRDALSSVSKEPGRAIELIVVDDARDAATAEVVASAAGAVYVPGPMRGPAAARNLGLRRASCDLVALLDHDDRLVPHGIGRRADLFTEHTIVALGAAQMFTDPGNRVTGVQVAPHVESAHCLMAECTIVSCSVAMVDRHVVLDAGGFDESLLGADDWDLWIRLADIGEFATTQAVVAEWRVGHPSLSRSNPAHGDAMRAVIARMPTTHRDCADCRRLARIASRRMDRHIARRASRGRRAAFVAAYPRAISEWPVHRLAAGLRRIADRAERGW